MKTAIIAAIGERPMQPFQLHTIAKAPKNFRPTFGITFGNKPRPHFNDYPAAMPATPYHYSMHKQHPFTGELPATVTDMPSEKPNGFGERVSASFLPAGGDFYFVPKPPIIFPAEMILFS